MALFLTNTLSRKKERFVPLDPSHIGMYVCGPTVYDRIHIGNARPLVVFDVLYRLLKRLYPKVTYVRNITDVDDKINARAKERGISIAELTQRTSEFFHGDAARLGVSAPDVEPRATAHIRQMIAMIENLIARGHAYAAEGHVLFSVPSMPEYGGLSGRHMDEMIAGARVEVAPYKRAPADFVLWKPSPDDLPGWESPWGRGRPGWHIECSAMSREYLGPIFDIHGGGQDLIFPHHENEVAQSRCANEAKYLARYWVHNGHINMSGEKMSKSLGNIVPLHVLLSQAPGEAVRLALLSAHYHQPMDWSEDGLSNARATMDRFYQALRHVEDIAVIDVDPPSAVMEALEDDLNTPLALSHLHELVGALNKAHGMEDKAKCKSHLLSAGALLGLFHQTPEGWFRWSPEGGDVLSEERIHALIEERLAARKAKNWAEADRIRKELSDQGVLLEDKATGTIWRRGG